MLPCVEIAVHVVEVYDKTDRSELDSVFSSPMLPLVSPIPTTPPSKQIKQSESRKREQAHKLHRRKPNGHLWCERIHGKPLHIIMKSYSNSIIVESFLHAHTAELQHTTCETMHTHMHTHCGDLNPPYRSASGCYTEHSTSGRRRPTILLV